MKNTLKMDDTNILNEKNKFITKEFINNLLLKHNISYKIKNIDIFQQSMTHPTYTEKNYEPSTSSKKKLDVSCSEQTETDEKKNSMVPLQKLSYERNEFLGDSVIHLSIGHYLYDRYPTEQEGFMTRLRAKLENGPTLAKFSRALNLNEYVLIAKSIEILGGRNNTKILEDIFEAFIASLYLDIGNDNDALPICKKLIISLIEKEINIAQLLYKDTNYKDTLLRYHHSQKWPVPKYDCINIINNNSHEKIFCMCVMDCHGNIIGTGKGTTKRKGEQLSAKEALTKYGKIKDYSDSDSDDIEVATASEEIIYEE